MKELFVYFCAIFILLYLAFVALHALNPSIQPYNFSVFEGLENAKSSTPATDTMSVTGVGSASQLYGQTLTTAISALETELGLDAYSEQYLSILNNLKTLYTQRALKMALQTPTKGDNPNVNNQFPLYLYGQNIQTIERLEDFIKSRKKVAGVW